PPEPRQEQLRRVDLADGRVAGSRCQVPGVRLSDTSHLAPGTCISEPFRRTGGIIPPTYGLSRVARALRRHPRRADLGSAGAAPVSAASGAVRHVLGAGSGAASVRPGPPGDAHRAEPGIPAPPR